MTTQIPADIAVLSLELELRRLAERFPAGWPKELASIEFETRGIAWQLRAGPPAAVRCPVIPPKGPTLTACQHQVLRIVRARYQETRRRMVAHEVRAALEATGVSRGRSAVQAALTELVGLDLLVNDNDKRGYGPPDPDYFG